MMKLILNIALILVSQSIYAQTTPENFGSAGGRLWTAMDYR